MDADNLKRRIWSARVEMERTAGLAETPTAIVIHPIDWHLVQMSRPNGALVTPTSFMGIPVNIDPRRDRGAVALAWIKEV